MDTALYQSAVIMTHLTAELLPTGKARVAPWCGAPQATRNAASGQKNAAFGGEKRVIIIALWY